MRFTAILIGFTIFTGFYSCRPEEMQNPFSGNLIPGSIHGTLKMDDHVVWCGGVIQHDDGKFYMFASIWPGPDLGNWVTGSQVALAVADNPEGPFAYKGIILPYRESKYWDGMMTHNPVIQKHANTYYLFYTGTTYNFERPEIPVNNRDPRFQEAWHNKRIGVATAKHPAGPWTRFDKPIIEPRKGYWDEVLTSNPAPVIHEDGSVTLIYKSSNAYFPERIKMAEGHNGLPKFIIGTARAEHVFGEYKRVGDMDGMVNVEGELVSLEDPYVWYDGKFYHMIIKNFYPVFNTERMGAIYLWSKDAVNWRLPEGNPGTYSLNITWKEGITTTQEKLERPQVLLEDGKPAWLYLATRFREEEMKYTNNKVRIYNVVFRIRQ
jgi:hypothetical protein